jgi:2,4-dichlorophenol 6-monooxygenase
MTRVDVPVLVVGGGPVGMMASILLARQGVASRVVERRAGPHRAPQAHVVNPRTLEICRAVGIDVDRLRGLATPRADGSQVVWMTSLAGEELGRLPYERQGDDCLVDTPTPLLNLSQHLFEPVLLERLRAEPLAAIAYGHQCQGLRADADGVTADVEDLTSGERHEVRSRYVIAADGAGSRIRRALGIEMVGPDRLQTFVMIHFEADLRALVRTRPAILYWTVDPECAGAFVAHDIDRTWVFMHPYDPESQPVETFDERTCAAIVRRAIGRDVPLAVRDVSPWTMTAQVADRYRAGRVFLAGDAAHRFPPSGGLGMNTGIQDVDNLAWKLRLVLDGAAGDRLLDTYEIERRPVARENADHSMQNAFRMLEVFEALGVPIELGADRAAARARMRETLADDAGRARVRAAIEHQRDHFDTRGLQLGFAYEDGALVPDGSPAPCVANRACDYVPSTRPGAHLPHAWVARAGERISTLDLVAHDRFTLIAGPAAARAIDDPTVHTLVAGRDFGDPDGRWAALAEMGDDGALLVRPDRHVAWRASGAMASTERLASALARIVARAGIAPARWRAENA